MKMIATREQTRLEARRLWREVDVDWLGIKLLREDLGWSLVEEGGEGVSSSSFLNLLNERFANLDPVDFDEGASFMESLKKWGGDNVSKGDGPNRPGQRLGGGVASHHATW